MNKSKTYIYDFFKQSTKKMKKVEIDDSRSISNERLTIDSDSISIVSSEETVYVRPSSLKSELPFSEKKNSTKLITSRVAGDTLPEKPHAGMINRTLSNRVYG